MDKQRIMGIQTETGNELQSESSYDLGLDISTATVGFCFLERESGKLKLFNAIKIKEKQTLWDKADQTIEELKQITQSNHINRVERIFVEENAKVFKTGFSSAETLMTLAKMNALVSYLCYKFFNAEVKSVNVNAARKLIGFKNNKLDKRPVKDKVFEFVSTTHPEFPWEKYIPKSGSNKGNLVYKPEMKDTCDAWVVCYAGNKLNAT